MVSSCCLAVLIHECISMMLAPPFGQDDFFCTSITFTSSASCKPCTSSVRANSPARHFDFSRLLSCQDSIYPVFQWHLRFDISGFSKLKTCPFDSILLSLLLPSGVQSNAGRPARPALAANQHMQYSVILYT